jgi:hypothetical protein
MMDVNEIVYLLQESINNLRKVQGQVNAQESHRLQAAIEIIKAVKGHDHERTTDTND